MKRTVDNAQRFLRQHAKACAAATLAASFVAVHGFAQMKSKPSEQQAPYTLRQTVQEVILFCSVVDKQGKLADNLQQSNFTVSDNKQKVPIVQFLHRDVPVSMALVVDDSGSMSSKRDAVQVAALDLVKASNPQDEAVVFNFADQSYIDQDFSSDLDLLRAGLEKGKRGSGGTALYDTLIKAADHLTQGARQSKQIIVVITDGKDNASMASLEEAIHRVQATNGPVIYTIGLLYDSGGSDARTAKNALKQLADQTGGLSFFPSSLNEVNEVAAEVARDIRSQYRLAIRPSQVSPKDQPYHTIEVTAISPGAGKLIVRTRRGYLRK